MTAKTTPAAQTHHGFTVGRGYNSLKTGDFYLFIGKNANGRLVFWRTYAQKAAYLSPRRARDTFDHDDPRPAEDDDQEGYAEGLELLDVGNQRTGIV